MPKKRPKRGGLRRQTKQLSPVGMKGVSGRQDFIPKINILASEALKKPRLEAILFCDYANRTQEGKLMLVGCFERIIFSQEEQKVSMPFFLFFRTAETTDGFLQVSIIAPNEKIVLAFQFDTSKLKFAPDAPANVDFLQQIQFPAPHEGFYWFDVAYKGESLGGAPLAIEFRTEETNEDERKAGDIEQEHVGS